MNEYMYASAHTYTLSSTHAHTHTHTRENLSVRLPLGRRHANGVFQAFVRFRRVLGRSFFSGLPCLKRESFWALKRHELLNCP